MKNFFLIILLSISLNAFALPPTFDWRSHQSVYGFSAGKFDADFSMLNNQMKLWGMTKQFNNYYYSIGFSSTSNPDDASTSLEWILPTEIKSAKEDSLVFKMYGWHYTTSGFGLDVIPGDAIALVLSLGIDWGNVKLKRTLEGTTTKYKNPFVAPLAKVDLRFVLGKFSVGGRAMYRYDITHDIWKRKADLLPILPGSKMSGLGVQVYIGYGEINY